MAPTTDHPKPAALRRRRRKADLLAGRVPVEQQQHGNGRWAVNWGCECLTCKDAVRKINRDAYLARKAKATEGLASGRDK